MRNMKMLGLLAVSAMALAAFVGTTSASAAKFTAAGAGNSLSSSIVTNHAFSFEGNKTECEEISFGGETEGSETSQQIVSPSYKKCKAFGFANATVTTGTCRYEFKAATDAASMATKRLFGCADSTTGIKVSIHVPGIATCVVDIPEQVIVSAVGYSVSGSSTTITETETGIMYDVTFDSGLCPLGGVGTKTAGAYTGVTTIIAPGGFVFDP